MIAQHSQNAVDPITYEAIACALELCDKDCSRIEVIIPGEQTEKAAREIADTSGMEVIALEHSLLQFYNAEAYVRALTGTLNDLAPEYVVLPHTSTGFDLAPALAIKLKASCITAVEDINHDKGKHSFIRSLSSGRLYAEVVPETKSTVITVQPGAWQAASNSSGNTGRISTRTPDIEACKSRTVEIKHAVYKGTDIAKSEVIVSAGRGIGKKENLQLLYDLAGIFKKSAVGCSRPVCDAGWMEYSHQVGVTGATVSPKLYFACGISGALQHISGIRGAQTIIAVNTDPQARIFGIADYCVVEDLTEFLPVLMEEFKTMKHTG